MSRLAIASCYNECVIGRGADYSTLVHLIMQKPIIILLTGAALAFVFTRASKRTTPAWAQHLKGWQKLFGVAALALTVLIIINPEFLALGILGDTAFIDMLVLALSLSLNAYAAQAGRLFVVMVGRGMRWIRIPSPGLRYLIGISILVIGMAGEIVQRAASCRFVSR